MTQEQKEIRSVSASVRFAKTGKPFVFVTINESFCTEVEIDAVVTMGKTLTSIAKHAASAAKLTNHWDSELSERLHDGYSIPKKCSPTFWSLFESYLFSRGVIVNTFGNQLICNYFLVLDVNPEPKPTQSFGLEYTAKVKPNGQLYFDVNGIEEELCTIRFTVSHEILCEFNTK